eukprot:scaffold31485_cov112-Isochrysis_galbana.AAC.2
MALASAPERGELGPRRLLRLWRLHEVVPVVLAVHVALLERLGLANLAGEDHAQLDAAVQIAQRRLGQVVHVVAGVGVHHGPDRRLGAGVQNGLPQLLVAAD